MPLLWTEGIGRLVGPVECRRIVGNAGTAAGGAAARVPSAEKAADDAWAVGVEAAAWRCAGRRCSQPKVSKVFVGSRRAAEGCHIAIAALWTNEEMGK